VETDIQPAIWKREKKRKKRGASLEEKEAKQTHVEKDRKGVLLGRTGNTKNRKRQEGPKVKTFPL